MQKVSIIIPVYNEKDTIIQILKKIEETDFSGLEKEIVIVDDASDDGTTDILKNFSSKYKIIFHSQNKGKGAAVKQGISFSTGDFIVIQDADLEYSPEDYNNILPLLIEGKAVVVYGSRFLNKNKSDNFIFKNKLANKFLTMLTSILFFSEITDMETCYKAFKADFIKNIKINSNRFNFEAEVTAKVLKSKVSFKEVPISYVARKHSEGKKIGWKDGIQAILTLIKYRFVD